MVVVYNCLHVGCLNMFERIISPLDGFACLYSNCLNCVKVTVSVTDS